MDVEPASLLLVGEHRGHAGIRRKHRRLETVQACNELCQRHVRRKHPDPLSAPLLQACRSNGRREMAAGRHDHRHPPAAGDDFEEVTRAEPVTHPAEHHGSHDRHRAIVDQENAAAAGRAGGGHHGIFSEEPLAAYWLPPLAVRFCRLERDGAVGAPFVEALHEHLLVGDREQLGAFNPIRQTTVQLTVVWRIGPGMGDHVGETGAPALRDCVRALLSCAPGVPDQAYDMLGHSRSRVHTPPASRYTYVL